MHGAGRRYRRAGTREMAQRAMETGKYAAIEEKTPHDGLGKEVSDFSEKEGRQGAEVAFNAKK